jgi:hypothetical protein
MYGFEQVSHPSGKSVSVSERFYRNLNVSTSGDSWNSEAIWPIIGRPDCSDLKKLKEVHTEIRNFTSPVLPKKSITRKLQ